LPAFTSGDAFEQNGPAGFDPEDARPSGEHRHGRPGPVVDSHTQTRPAAGRRSLLAAHLATEPGGLTFRDLSDRAHLHTVEATLEPSGIQLCDRTDESFLQFGFGGHAHQRTWTIGVRCSTARRGRNHPRDDADDQRHGHLHDIGGLVDVEAVLRPGVEHVERERARDRGDGGEPGAPDNGDDPPITPAEVARDDCDRGSSGRLLGAGPSIVADGPSTSSCLTCSIVRSK